jgi:hypothetical protein
VAICICGTCDAQFTVFIKSVRKHEPVRARPLGTVHPHEA